MRIRSLLVAAVGIVALVLAGCSTTVEGSAQAEAPVGAPTQAPGDDAAPDDPGSADDDTDDLSPPSDTGGGTLPDPTDGDAPGGSVTTDDLSDALGGLGDLGDLGDLGALLGGAGDASGLAGLTGLDPSCLSLLGVSMTVGMLMMGVTLGGSTTLTEKDVNDAFSGMSGSVPPEVKGDIDTLHQAALQAVGKSGAEAQQIFESDAVTGAMDNLSTYLDAHCDTE